MRVLVAVCCLALAAAVVSAGSLSSEELLELENILTEYEEVERTLGEGLTQLSEGLKELHKRQDGLMQGIVLLGQGENALMQQINGLETSLTLIESKQADTRKMIMLMGVAAVVLWIADKAAILVFKQ